MQLRSTDGLPVVLHASRSAVFEVSAWAWRKSRAFVAVVPVADDHRFPAPELKEALMITPYTKNPRFKSSTRVSADASNIYSSTT
jgi:hypothetical protein